MYLYVGFGVFVLLGTFDYNILLKYLCKRVKHIVEEQNIEEDQDVKDESVYV